MEGPSIIILKEEAQVFKGKKILGVGGNSKTNKERLLHLRIEDFQSWGKHFIICFPHFFVRIHFLMFGSYRINEKKDRPSRLSLQFKNGELNFYTCSVKIVEGDVNSSYDWRTDIMSECWDENMAFRSLKKLQDTLICDALLDQQIFSGVGNIIKNEVLFKIKIHPETRVGTLSSKQLKDLVKATRNYSFDFLEWKKIFQLRRHWLIYRKKKCPRCGFPVKMKYTGKGMRLSFFCNNCQLPTE